MGLPAQSLFGKQPFGKQMYSLLRSACFTGLEGLRIAAWGAAQIGFAKSLWTHGLAEPKRNIKLQSTRRRSKVEVRPLQSHPPRTGLYCIARESSVERVCDPFQQMPPPDPEDFLKGNWRSNLSTQIWGSLLSRGWTWRINVSIPPSSRALATAEAKNKLP